MDTLLFELENYNALRKELFKKNIDSEYIPYYDSFLNARYSKVGRIKKHLIFLLNRRKYAYFLTFTMDDSLLLKCDRTQRDIIKKCLFNYDENGLYILNVDYGKSTERKHFHCIFGTDYLNDFNLFLSLTYPCFFHCEMIRLKSADIKKVSKYINKLSNHTTKDSTRNKRVVYNFHAYDRLDKTLARLVFLYDKEKLGL